MALYADGLSETVGDLLIYANRVYFEPSTP